MNPKLIALLPLLAIALAGCGSGSSTPKSTALTAGDMRTALATYGVRVDRLVRSKEGCVVLIPSASNDFSTYGFFEIDISQGHACDASLASGAPGARGVYWTHAKGTWFGESRVGRNVWVQTNGKSRRRDSRASFVVRMVRGALYDVLRSR